MASPNARLLIHLKEIESRPVGYVALHLHLSSLPRGLRSRDNVAGAIAILKELQRSVVPSHIFLLSNLEIVFVGFNAQLGTLRSVAGKVHKIFGYQSLEMKNAYDSIDFYSIIDLAVQGRRLREFAESVAGLNAQPADEDGGRRVDVNLLSQIKERIRSTDLSSMVMNQPVYAVDASGRILPVFRELYVSIKTLEEALCPGVNLAKRRWLFNDLTEDLDAAVLRMLSKSADLGGKRFSLNLNLSAIESEAFAGFDQTLDKARRSNIVIEIHRNDLVANFNDFRRLAPALVERGYSLCIDALETSLLPHLDLGGLHCRFAKLFWSDEAAEAGEILAERNARDDGVTYILARCDNAEAVRVARKAGIELLQGKLIDHMVKNNIPV